MEKITLSKDETEILRKLFWKLKDAQVEMQVTVNDIAKVHKINLEKEQWNLSEDMKIFNRLK